MFSIIDIDTGEDKGYYMELSDAIRDFSKAIVENKGATLVIIDTERELVIRWAC